MAENRPEEDAMTDGEKEKDKLFDRKRDVISDFDFGEDTASVFDDMLDRSVPYYAEIQRMMGEIAADFAVPGTKLYDLGCSTGITLLILDKVVSEDVGFVGIDNSEDMLKKAEEKIQKTGMSRKCELIALDLNQGIPVMDASVVIMCLTLQFMRPLYREKIIQTIADGLNPGGCLILVEKLLSENSTINRLFIKYYYEMKKRKGYSDLEIVQKREALENVLIPYRLEENEELLLNNGFKACDVFFRWYNFCGILAIK